MAACAAVKIWQECILNAIFKEVGHFVTASYSSAGLHKYLTAPALFDILSNVAEYILSADARQRNCARDNLLFKRFVNIYAKICSVVFFGLLCLKGS